MRCQLLICQKACPSHCSYFSSHCLCFCFYCFPIICSVIHWTSQNILSQVSFISSCLLPSHFPSSLHLSTRLFPLYQNIHFNHERIAIVSCSTNFPDDSPFHYVNAVTGLFSNEIDSLQSVCYSNPLDFIETSLSCPSSSADVCFFRWLYPGFTTRLW